MPARGCPGMAAASARAAGAACSPVAIGQRPAGTTPAFVRRRRSDGVFVSIAPDNVTIRAVIMELSRDVSTLAPALAQDQRKPAGSAALDPVGAAPAGSLNQGGQSLP